MSDKRIIDLPTLQQALGNDAWLVVDIESGATYKIKKSALLGLQSLETQSQEVYGAINEVRSLAEDLVSDEYSPTSAYAKGDYCIYNNTLYKCTTAIATGGETWNASHWSATKCDSELSELKGTLPTYSYYNFNSDVQIQRYGHVVSLSVGAWYNFANLVIPAEYRPNKIIYTLAEQRDGNNTNLGFQRININTDGTIQPNLSGVSFIGLFTWIID